MAKVLATTPRVLKNSDWARLALIPSLVDSRIDKSQYKFANAQRAIAPTA